VQRAGRVGEGCAAYIRFSEQTDEVEDLLHEYLAVSSFLLRREALVAG